MVSLLNEDVTHFLKDITTNYIFERNPLPVLPVTDPKLYNSVPSIIPGQNFEMFIQLPHERFTFNAIVLNILCCVPVDSGSSVIAICKQTLQDVHRQVERLLFSEILHDTSGQVLAHFQNKYSWLKRRFNEPIDTDWHIFIMNDSSMVCIVLEDANEDHSELFKLQFTAHIHRNKSKPFEYVEKSLDVEEGEWKVLLGQQEPAVIDYKMKEMQDYALAFTMGTHPNLGSKSPIQNMPPEMLREMYMAFLRELDEKVPFSVIKACLEAHQSQKEEAVSSNSMALKMTVACRRCGLLIE